MATQTGIATSKVIILVVGAGVTGHMVLGKATLSDVIGKIQEILFKSQNDDSGGQNSDNSALQTQIARLAQEVRQLYGGRQITVVNASDQNSNLASYIVPIAVVSAAGYGYMWWKGWSISDIMYVTKKSMANAVSSFNKQLDQVSTALAAVKKHLSQRMEKLNAKMDEQKEITGAIRLEVGEVREDLAQMGLDIDCVQRLVEGLGTKIDKIEGKQDLTNAGVVYLCHFVQGLAGAGQQKPELLKSFSGKARLERSPTSAIGLGGLKELQYFKEALQPDKPFTIANDVEAISKTTEIATDILNPSGPLHRTMKVC